jgi:tRNA threonylcarbamoyladenosine biosynthesis protein TsaB
VLILALDTTTRAGSVAVTDDDRVLAARPGNPARTHGERLPGEIDEALREAAVTARAIDLLVVASGPGAFTGLRIGLAAMQGLAMTLDRPIVGVSALDALAWTALADVARDDLRRGRSLDRPKFVATWMDAQRGEVFSALYRAASAEPPWIVVAEPAVGPPDATIDTNGLDRQMPTLFVGDGARRYAETIAATSSQWTVSLHDPLLAPALAWLGRRQLAHGGAAAPHALQPLYVRRPDAEIERERRNEP